MPQRSKKPMKKAILRASSTRVGSASSTRTTAKATAKGAKRSAPARAAAKAKPSARGKVAPKAKAKVAPKAKIAPKVKAKIAPKVKAKVSRKPAALFARKPAAKPARAARSLILPPKPTRLAARLLVAPAPRTPVVVELARSVSLPPAARAPLSFAPSAPRDTVPVRQSALRLRERAPRARVTVDTWRQLEESCAKLGRSQLTDEQRVAIRAALEGHDSLVVMPDDERAVSCYQLVALHLSEPTVVVSPVVAELKAQQAALSERHFAVVCVLPEQTGPERSAALSRVARGGSLLVLLTPEALRMADVQQALAKSSIALFVVEEAHCASEASHELRPSYAEFESTLRQFDSPPVMAVTRVATSAVRRDIRERLGLAAPVTVLAAPVRDNLKIVTKLARGEGRQASLVRLVERLELPGLVYCATPHDVDGVYAALLGAGIAVHRHHSGMTPGDRAAELLNFTLPGQRSVMVALSAFAPSSGLPGIGEQAEGFGRGPSKRDLRFVVHYQSPASIEQYLREIQRAGGDGKPALCVLLHESSHRTLHEVMLAQQRFKATHLAELGRALESPALEGRTVTLEALALGTGQSRRTTDRLTALLADAGLVSRAVGWVRVLCTATELDEGCRRLGAQLYALRERDARRLASVSAFAESSECKFSCLNQYLGDGMSEPCGRCNACVPELLAPSQESLIPQASMRRAVVQEFSVQTVAHSHSGVVPSGAHSRPSDSALTAKLADLGGSNTLTHK
jgi:ATP-dependent DNA helicase RecQ